MKSLNRVSYKNPYRYEEKYYFPVNFFAENKKWVLNSSAIQFRFEHHFMIVIDVITWMLRGVSDVCILNKIQIA